MPGAVVLLHADESICCVNEAMWKLYDCQSKQEFLNLIGSSFRGMVMHMSRTAIRTARALDILLTKNEQRPEGDPKKFKVGLLGDYLRDGYDQRMTTPKDMREKQIDY